MRTKRILDEAEQKAEGLAEKVVKDLTTAAIAPLKITEAGLKTVDRGLKRLFGLE